MESETKATSRPAATGAATAATARSKPERNRGEGRDEMAPPSGAWAKFNYHVRPLLFVVLVMLSLQSSVADWNEVPTGSMRPNILEGDRIFVNKLAYDLKVPFTTWHLAEWGDPQRGDVVVFFSPKDGIRLVKRVVGVPGDVVELRGNRIILNGAPAAYGPPDPKIVNMIPAWQRPAFTLDAERINGGPPHPVMGMTAAALAGTSFGPVKVPPGKYFLLGDNRDNSSDSRVWGFADRDQIVGRAVGVAASMDPKQTLSPRWERFFTPLP